MRQTISDPPNLPYPTRRCEERERASRSSTCTLLVVVESAGPVAGVTSGKVQLRSAVEEVVGDVLHLFMLTGWPPATGSAALAAINAVSERPARTSGELKIAWRPLHAIFASHSSRLHPSLCLPAAAPQRASEVMPLRLAGNGVRWTPATHNT
jgi:hypothetical protein